MARLLSPLILALGPAMACASSVRKTGQPSFGHEWPGSMGSMYTTTAFPMFTTPPGPTTAPPLAPYSGAPFEIQTKLDEQPPQHEDMKNPEMLVNRLRFRHSDQEKDTASPHACDLGVQPDKDKCLHVEGRNCMWTRVESRDPLKMIQTSQSYCQPCRLDGQAIPCWNIGAWIGGNQVTDCEMSCDHQEKLMQKNYACSDETGFISQMQCFEKGARSGSKCMFIAYEVDGHGRASCAPCEVAGTGSWGCPPVDGPGPVEGSKVQSCLSQCDVLCAGPPACPPTVAPPPPPPPPSPGAVDPGISEDEMVSAPVAMVMPTVNPWSIIQSAREAALKAGFYVPGTTPLPKVYYPVIYYRSPQDNIFTTGAPPLNGPEPPIVNQIVNQAMAANMNGLALLQSDQLATNANAEQHSIETPLRRLRRRSRGA